MDLYQEVTNRIMEQLENGIIPWEKPWISAGNAVSHATGKPYSLLNQMLLGRPGEYVTFKQCQAEGGKVRKGEKSSMVVFWKWIEEKDPYTEEVRQIPFLRYFNVFHIDQCEGLSAKHTHEPSNTVSPDQTAEGIISGYAHSSGVKLIHQEGDRAFYRPSTDNITLPLMAQFKDV
jgi:antirestriction protein ArdC